jgi:hypothetical protein
MQVRPLTHDLMKNMLQEVGYRVTKVGLPLLAVLLVVLLCARASVQCTALMLQSIICRLLAISVLRQASITQACCAHNLLCAQQIHSMHVCIRRT